LFQILKDKIIVSKNCTQKFDGVQEVTSGPTLIGDGLANSIHVNFMGQPNSTHILQVKYETCQYETDQPVFSTLTLTILL